MKRLILIMVAVLLAGHVWAQRRAKVKPVYYDYVIALTGSHCGEGGLLFEDDLIAAGFVVGNREIGFMMRNKGPMPLLIVWDETNIILDGVAKRVLPDGVKYADRDKSHPPTLIPPGAAVDRSMVPVENIRFYSGAYTGPEWFVAPMFISHDGGAAANREKILARKGDVFSVFMTLERGGEKHYYTWEFVVEDVVERKGL